MPELFNDIQMWRIRGKVYNEKPPSLPIIATSHECLGFMNPGVIQNDNGQSVQFQDELVKESHQKNRVNGFGGCFEVQFILTGQ